MKPRIYHISPSSEFYLDENCYITELLNDDDDPAVSIARARVIPADCPQRIANRGPADLVFLAVCSPRFDPANYQDLEDQMQGNGEQP